MRGFVKGVGDNVLFFCKLCYTERKQKQHWQVKFYRWELWDELGFSEPNDPIQDPLLYSKQNLMSF